jgi:hypothetical protein
VLLLFLIQHVSVSCVKLLEKFLVLAPASVFRDSSGEEFAA